MDGGRKVSGSISTIFIAAPLVARNVMMTFGAEKIVRVGIFSAPTATPPDIRFAFCFDVFDALFGGQIPFLFTFIFATAPFELTGVAVAVGPAGLFRRHEESAAAYTARSFLFHCQYPRQDLI